jgi:hypothetical protein
MLRTYFTDFLEIVEPGLVRNLDVVGVSFPTREELIDWPEEDLRDLGLLAEVLTRRGDLLSVVVRVEDQEGDRAVLQDRLLGAFLRLAVNGHQPVRLIVLHLHGGRPGIHLEWIVDTVDGEELLRVPYLAFGLEGCPAERYKRQANPIAWALSAFMRPILARTTAPVRVVPRRLAGLA